MEFCIQHLSELILIVSIYAFSLLLFVAVMAGLWLKFRKKTGGKKALRKVGIWLFLLFIEVPTIASLTLIELNAELANDILRFLVVLVILTAMMATISLTRSYYYKKYSKLAKLAKTDRSARAYLTQAMFVYRLIVCGIILLAAGSVFIVFPYIRSVGIGILGSAGIAGIAIGLAAKPIILNLIVGFQIGMNKMIKIGDKISVKGYLGDVESIFLTRLVIKTWDNKRVFLPISILVDEDFETYDYDDGHPIGTVMLYLDYGAPLEAIREKFDDIVEDHPLYDGQYKSVVVSDLRHDTIEIRLAVSAGSYGDNYMLRCDIREQMMKFLVQNFPAALPCFRYKNFKTPAEQLK